MFIAGPTGIIKCIHSGEFYNNIIRITKYSLLILQNDSFVEENK